MLVEMQMQRCRRESEDRRGEEEKKERWTGTREQGATAGVEVEHRSVMIVAKRT